MRDERNVSLPESARSLRQKLCRVRRKARLVLLGEAFLAAVAADLLYDFLSLGLFLFTGVSIYFPPFFLVALSVLVLRLFLKTRLLPLSRALDRKHHLKERLTSAFFYDLSDRVSSPILEAQARETLEAVNFSSLHASYAFRPKYSAAAIVLLVTALGGIMWKYPGLFTPANFVYRQGTRIVSSYQHGGPLDEQFAMFPGPPLGEDPEIVSRNENDSSQVEDESAGTLEEAGQESDLKDIPAEEMAAEKKEAEDSPKKSEDLPPQPEPSDRKQDTPPQRGKESPRTASSDHGGTLLKSPSVETTDRSSPLADKPYRGLAPEPLGFAFREAAAYLPPIPLFQLIMKDAAQGALMDPESVTIVPEAYQEKYRQHIVAYFEKLQSLREEQNGP